MSGWIISHRRLSTAHTAIGVLSSAPPSLGVSAWAHARGNCRGGKQHSQSTGNIDQLWHSCAWAWQPPLWGPTVSASHLWEAAKPFLRSVLWLVLRDLILYAAVLERERSSYLCLSDADFHQKSFNRRAESESWGSEAGSLLCSISFWRAHLNHQRFWWLSMCVHHKAEMEYIN